jgi:ribosomal protein S18 acetylase RimI-like enzyme
LELYSNTRLQSALHLYRKYGFVEIPLPEDCVYDRANIRMELSLSEAP